MRLHPLLRGRTQPDTEPTKRRKTLRKLVFALVTILAFGAAAAAWAYFTTTGSGSGSATVGTLAAPTNVTATQPDTGVDTVHVTWTGVTNPGSGNFGYYVRRFVGSTPSAACGTSPASLTTNLTCNDTNVPDGTYTYKVTAVYNSWTAVSAPSSALTVATVSATLDHFTLAPSTPSPVAGSSFTVAITAKDASNATLTSYTGTQCITFTGPSSSPNNTAPTYPAVGSCGTGSAVTFVGGVATGANAASITLVKAETVTLTATDNPTSGTGTTSLTVSNGSASRLRFLQQPSNSTGGVAFGTQPQVAIEDAFGNTVIGDSSSVTLAIKSGTPTSGGPGALTCTANPKAAISGIATFAGCAINITGTGYQLRATDGGLTAADSTSFNISTGPAASLTFSTQPSSATGGVAFGTQPVVTVRDAGTNVVSGTAVTLAITSGTPATGGPGALTCTANPVSSNGSGLAAFAGCKINTAGTNYRLTATSGALTATSNTFNITVGTATQLTFTQQPNGGANNVAWSTQPRVTVQDAGGNTVTSPNVSVTLAIDTQPGSGAALTCTSNPLNSATGVATFAGCKIVGAAGSYTLKATSGALTLDTSDPFSITTGAAALVDFTQQPNGGANDTVWTTQPQVTVKDSGNNIITGSSASITLSVASGTGTLTCTTNPLAASSGVANFAGCKIVGTAGNFTLTAASSGLTSDTSSAFAITAGTATKLAVTQQPNGGANNAAWSTQPKVTVQDSSGNTVTGSSAPILLTINTQPGSGATLTCTTNPLGATAGVATFGGCKIVGTIGSYTLNATSAGLTSATSSSFNITVGAAAQVAFTQQPNGGANNVAFTTQPQVTVQDSGGNTVTSSSASILLAVNTQPGSGALLSCTANPKNASSGVDLFAGCKISGTIGTYTLNATSAGLVPAVSNTFSITLGTVSQFGVTPSTATPTAGSAFTVTLTAQDAGGNTVTSYTGAKTIAWSGPTVSPKGTNPIPPTTSVTFSSGLSTTTLNATLFDAGSNTLTATASGPTVIGSASLTVGAGAFAGIQWANPMNGTVAATLPCSFTNIQAVTCALAVGNGGSFTANVALGDLYGNIGANNGTGSTITVTETHSGPGTETTTGSMQIVASTSTTPGTYKIQIPTGNPAATTITASITVSSVTYTVNNVVTRN